MKLSLFKEARTFIDCEDRVLVINGLIPFDFQNLYSNNMIKEIIITSVDKNDIGAMSILEKVRLIGKIDTEVFKKLRDEDCSIILAKNAKLQMGPQ